MAILIRKTTRIAGESIELKTYHPAGLLTKDERLRADKLDNVLRTEVPHIALEALEEANPSNGWVHLYYLLGQKIRKMFEADNFISPIDIQNGLIWRSIWEYLPIEYKDNRRSDAKSYEKMQKDGFDPLAISYRISEFQWKDIKNIRRQDDWNHLSHRPAIFRDERILRHLEKAIGELKIYPSRSEFHKIVKRLGHEFPSRKGQDSKMISENKIKERVQYCVFKI